MRRKKTYMTTQRKVTKVQRKRDLIQKNGKRRKSGQEMLTDLMKKS